jgi:hypothetical protein
MGILMATMTAGVQPSAAAERPYCLSGNRANGGMPDCSYHTWAQCIASTSGSDTCYINPFYTGPRPQGTPRRQPQRY